MNGRYLNELEEISECLGGLEEVLGDGDDQDAATIDDVTSCLSGHGNVDDHAENARVGCETFPVSILQPDLPLLPCPITIHSCLSVDQTIPQALVWRQMRAVLQNSMAIAAKQQDLSCSSLPISSGLKRSNPDPRAEIASNPKRRRRCGPSEAKKRAARNRVRVNGRFQKREGPARHVSANVWSPACGS
jgi:hypothetical protein